GADHLRHPLERDVLVMSRLFFRRRSENWFAQFAGDFQTWIETNAAYRPRLLIFLPARSDQVATRDAFDRNDAAFPHDDAATAQLGMGSSLRRKFLEVGFEEMILDVLEMLEPEIRDLIEDASLVGDAGRQDDIEGRDAIGGHEQKRLAEVVHVAYFSSASERKRERGIEQRA